MRSGRLGGALLPSPPGDAAGVALWEPGVPVGRRATIVLDPGFATPAAFGSFVDALDDDVADGPLVGIKSPLVRVPEREATAVLDRRGFAPIDRIECRFPEDRSLPEVGMGDRELRPLRPEETDAFAALLDAAYADYPADLLLFRRYPERRDDLAAAARHLLGGELGEFWPDASFAVDDPARSGRLLGAVVVNLLEVPLVTELLVAPSARRRGLGRSLLAAAVAGARRRRPGPVRLNVSLGNRRAFDLYRSAGWVPAERSRSRDWVRARAFGVDPGDAPYDP